MFPGFQASERGELQSPTRLVCRLKSLEAPEGREP